MFIMGMSGNKAVVFYEHKYHLSHNNVLEWCTVISFKTVYYVIIHVYIFLDLNGFNHFWMTVNENE